MASRSFPEQRFLVSATRFLYRVTEFKLLKNGSFFFFFFFLSAHWSLATTMQTAQSLLYKVERLLIRSIRLFSFKRNWMIYNHKDGLDIFTSRDIFCSLHFVRTNRLDIGNKILKSWLEKKNCCRCFDTLYKLMKRLTCAEIISIYTVIKYKSESNQKSGHEQSS